MGLHQLPKTTENPAYVDCSTGEAFTKCILTLSCSPCGLKRTRALWEDLDAAWALSHMLHGPMLEIAVRLQHALKKWD